MVREARLQGRLGDGARMHGVVMRNRLSLIDSGNKERISRGLSEMATRIGFRVAEGLAERVVYREFFPRGLTAMDERDDQTLGITPSPPPVAARQQATGLMEIIKLP